jgi:hypothetical protein
MRSAEAELRRAACALNNVRISANKKKAMALKGKLDVRIKL